MLVVNLDTLQPVDLLNFLDQILGQRFNPHDRKNVVRRRIAVQEIFALANHIAFLNRDMLALGDQIFGRIEAFVLGPDEDTPLVLIVTAKLYLAVDFGDHRVILRPAGLEQLGNPRQAAGNIARFRGFARDTGDHVAGMDAGPVFDRQDGVNRHLVTGFDARGQLDDLALFGAQDNLRL